MLASPAAADRGLGIVAAAVDILSVVICTYRRPSYLARALDSLSDQSLPRTDYEVIVVDNACDEDVRALAASYGAGLRVSYIAEPRVGLSRARNTGLKNVRGEVAVFMDDDAVATPRWLEAIRKTFAEGDSTVAMVGGPIALLWEKPRPSWLTDGFQPCLGHLDYGLVKRSLAAGEWLWGGNMAIRASALEEVGGFPTSLGRKGGSKQLISSEETIVQVKFDQRGLARMYSPSALVSHAVAADRLVPGWFVRRYYWQGVSAAIMTRLLERPTVLKRLRVLGRDMRRLFRQPKNVSALLTTAARSRSAVGLEERCEVAWLLGLVRGWIRPSRLPRVDGVSEEGSRQ